MANFSARPTTATIKRTILRTIQGLVSKSVYRAIELILSPCCHPVIKGTPKVECAEDKYIITIQLDKPINLYGLGVETLFLWIPDVDVFVAVKSIDVTTNTITFEIFGEIGGTLEASVEFYLPTSSDGLIGVSLSTEPFLIDLECAPVPVPDCNCYQLINANVPGAPAGYSYEVCDGGAISSTLSPQSQTVICARTISADTSKAIQTIKLDACNNNTSCVTPAQTCVLYSISNPTEEPLDATYTFCGDKLPTTTTINGGDLIIVCVGLGSLSVDPGLVVLVTGVGCSAS